MGIPRNISVLLGLWSLKDEYKPVLLYIEEHFLKKKKNRFTHLLLHTNTNVTVYKVKIYVFKMWIFFSLMFLCAE